GVGLGLGAGLEGLMQPPSTTQTISSIQQARERTAHSRRLALTTPDRCLTGHELIREDSPMNLALNLFPVKTDLRSPPGLPGRVLLTTRAFLPSPLSWGEGHEERGGLLRFAKRKQDPLTPNPSPPQSRGEGRKRRLLLALVGV